MSLLIDDVSRIVASPVSRRKMLGMLSGAIGGAMVASLGLRTAAFAAAVPPCKAGQTPCGTTCCGSPKVCVNGICCPAGDVNCGGKCCPGTCTNGLCCGKNTTYCNGKCCAAGNICCNGVCCTSSQAVCLNGKCCASGIVCNGVCCNPNQICCEGKKCVDKHKSPVKC